MSLPARPLSEVERQLTHPGEVLLEEVLKPLRLTRGAAAAALQMPVDDLEALVRCRRAVTAIDAERLAGWIGTSPEFWLQLQANHDATAR